MSKRKYTHMKKPEMQILSMRKSGMTLQEIADERELEKEPIKIGWPDIITGKPDCCRERQPNPRAIRKKPHSRTEEYGSGISGLQMKNKLPGNGNSYDNCDGR